MSKPVNIGPWPKGINNTTRSYALPNGSRNDPGWACVDAMNVDFTDQGFAVRRYGYSQTQAMLVGHSLETVGDKTLIVQAGELGVITSVNPLNITTLRTGLSSDRISYAGLAGEVWWSNGTESGRCNANNTDSPWAVPTPDDIPLIVSGAGTLFAGKYRVALTHVMTSGEESAACEIYEIDLAVDGSLVVTLPAAKAGVDYFRTYCSAADGSVLQHYSDVLANAVSVNITTQASGISLDDRAFLVPLPAGDIVAFHNGRLLSANDGDLYYSKPYNFGLCDPIENRLTLTAAITVVAPCEGGVFVCTTEKSYFYAGNDIAEAVVSEVLPFGAVIGTAFRHPDARAVGWFSDDGFVIGAPDGSVSLPQREKGFSAPTAASGNTWVRSINGETHLVCSLDGTARYTKEVSPDFTASRIRYDDDQTTVCMNLANGATSRYSNWFFTGTAQIDGDYYGIDTVGLRLLEGDADETDPIVAALDVGNIGMADMQICAPEFVYVSGKSSAKLVIDVHLPNGTVYSYPARSYNADTIDVQRHDGMKGLMNKRQSWFSVVIRNDDGCSMEVAAVKVLLGVSQRRIG